MTSDPQINSRLYDPEREVLVVESETDLLHQKEPLIPPMPQSIGLWLFRPIRKVVSAARNRFFEYTKRSAPLPSHETSSSGYLRRPEVLLILRKAPIEMTESMRPTNPNITVIVASPQDVEEYSCLVAQPIKSTRRKQAQESGEASCNTASDVTRLGEERHPLP